MYAVAGYGVFNCVKGGVISSMIIIKYLNAKLLNFDEAIIMF